MAAADIAVLRGALLARIERVAVEQQELHVALARVIDGVEAAESGLKGHLGSENGDDVEILRALVDHAEVVEVVLDIRDVLTTVDAEADHVVLGDAGLGHGDDDGILVVDVDDSAAGIVVDRADIAVDGDLPQALTAEEVAGLVHASHADGEGQAVKGDLDVHAARGHREVVAVGAVAVVDAGERYDRAVILAGDDDLGGKVRVGAGPAVAVAGLRGESHRVAGCAGSGGLPGGTVPDLVVHIAGALDNSVLADGNLAALEVGTDGDVAVGHLEVAVDIGLAVGLVDLLDDLRIRARAGDFKADEGHILAAGGAEIDIVAEEDVAVERPELLLGAAGDIGAGLELAGDDLAVAVDAGREAAVLVAAGHSRAVEIEGGGDGVCAAPEDRRDGDAALRHREGAGGGHRDLEAVAVADDIIALDRIACLGRCGQGDRGAGVGLVGGAARDFAADRGQDDDVVALGAECHRNIHVKAGHGEGVAEGVHNRAGGMVRHRQAGGLIPVERLGDDRDLGALGRAGHRVAVDLEIEAAGVGRVAGRVHRGDIEAVGGHGLEDDLYRDVGVGHKEGVGGAHRDGRLVGGGDHLVVGGRDALDLIVGIGAAHNDRRALDRRLDGHAADGGAGLAAVVGDDVDVVAGLDGGIDAHVAARHDEAVSGEAEVSHAVCVLDRQGIDGLAGLGLGDDRDGRAGGGRGDDGVVHIEEHGAVGGGHAARELIERGGGSGRRRGGAVSVRDRGGRGGGGAAAGVAGAGQGHHQGLRIEEQAAGLERGQIVRVVQRLEHTLCGVVVEPVLACDAVGGVIAHDLVRHDAEAGGADSGADRRRDDERVARPDASPVGDAVDVRNERRELREVHAEVVAHAGDRLTVGHGVGHQVVGEEVRAGLYGGGGVDAARRGGGGAGRGSPRDDGAGLRGGGIVGGRARAVDNHGGVIVAGRHEQRPADSQLVPLAVIDVVEHHDCVLAGVVVQTQSLADPQHKVALRHRVLNDIGARRCGGRVGRDGETREQAHHHQYRKQHTYDPFLHSCSP